MLGGGSHCHNGHMRFLTLFLLLVIFSAAAEIVYQGKVVRIVDGDTLVLLVDEKQHKIRLSDIDTPRAETALWHQGETGIIRPGLWQARSSSGSDGGPLWPNCRARIC